MTLLRRIFKIFVRKDSMLGYCDFANLYIDAKHLPRENRLRISNLVVKSNYKKSYFTRIKEVLK